MESSRVPGSPAGRHARPTGNGGIRMRSSVGGVGVACLLVSIAGLPAGALARCDDPAAVCAARAVADAQCNCATATTHGQYVKCVSQAAQGEVNAARLPRGCKANVVRCASRSTCGKPGFVTCCRTDSLGRVHCSVKRDPTRCKPPSTIGTKPSCCDACGPNWCATTTTSTTSTTSTRTTTVDSSTTENTSTTTTTLCGNGKFEPSEACDGTDVGGVTCP